MFAFLEKALGRRLALPNDGRALQDILGKRAVLQRDSHQTDMPGTKKERLKILFSRKPFEVLRQKHAKRVVRLPAASWEPALVLSGRAEGGRNPVRTVNCEW